MKIKNLSLAIFIATQFYSYSQKIEKIDLNSSILVLEKNIKQGDYAIELANLNSSNAYEVLATLNDIKIAELNFPNNGNAKLSFTPTTSNQKIGEFEISKGQKLVITITEKIPGLSKIQRKIVRTFTTGVKGNWQTTFGFNFVKLNNKTFF